MFLFKTRKEREIIIISAMIQMFCRNNHSSDDLLCDNCRNLLLYATRRVEHCRYQNDKPACSDCEIHCYAPGKKGEIKVIMRWAGPRMPFHYPLYALIHTIDSWKQRKRKSKN